MGSFAISQVGGLYPHEVSSAVACRVCTTTALALRFTSALSLDWILRAKLCKSASRLGWSTSDRHASMSSTSRGTSNQSTSCQQSLLGYYQANRRSVVSRLLVAALSKCCVRWLLEWSSTVWVRWSRSLFIFWDFCHLWKLIYTHRKIFDLRDLVCICWRQQRSVSELNWTTFFWNF